MRANHTFLEDCQGDRYKMLSHLYGIWQGTETLKSESVECEAFESEDSAGLSIKPGISLEAFCLLVAQADVRECYIIGSLLEIRATMASGVLTAVATSRQAMNEISRIRGRLRNCPVFNTDQVPDVIEDHVSLYEKLRDPFVELFEFARPIFGQNLYLALSPEQQFRTVSGHLEPNSHGSFYGYLPKTEERPMVFMAYDTYSDTLTLYGFPKEKRPDFLKQLSLRERGRYMMPSQKYISIIPFINEMEPMAKMDLTLDDPATAFPQTYGRLVGKKLNSGKLTSYIPMDEKNGDVFYLCRMLDSGILYIKNVPEQDQFQSDNGTQVMQETRYYLMYRSIDSTYLMPTCGPIENIANMDSKYTIEILLYNGEFKRFLLLTGKTGGVFSDSFFNLIGKIKGKIETWAKNGKNGFREPVGNEQTALDELEVQFFDSIGTPHWLAFESVDDILDCIVSARLVMVEETLTDNIH